MPYLVDYIWSLSESLADLISKLPDELVRDDISDGRAIIVTFTVTLFTALIAYFGARRRDAVNMRNSNSMRHYSSEQSELREIFQTHESSIFVHLTSSQPFEHEFIKNNRDEVGKLLNHFEVVAVGIDNGYLGERYVRRTERTYIISLFMCMSPHIKRTREHYQNPYAILNYERLFIRTFMGFHRNIWLPVEFVIGRPSFRLTSVSFQAEYHLNRLFYTKLLKSQVSGLFPESYLECDWIRLKKRLTKTRPFFLAAIILLVGLSIVLFG